MYLIVNQNGAIKDYTGHYQYVRRQKNGITAGCRKEDAEAIYSARTDSYFAIHPVLSEDSHKVVGAEDITADQLTALQAQKQTRNNAALAAYLLGNPVTWLDGKQYGITQEDQTEMSLNMMQYQLAVQAGQPAVLEWHAVREECRVFLVEELTGLTLQISEAVYPLIQKNQAIKARIYATTDLEELEAVEIAYP